MKDEEISNRLDQLSQGPWYQLGERARTFLLKFVSPEIASRQKPVLEAAFQEIRNAQGVISFSAIDALATKDGTDKRLSRLFRDHGEEAITDPDEIEIRDSLDEAFTYAQLLELAVETGYLPVGSVYAIGREQLAILLWPKAVRKFVSVYAYQLVQFLAARVDVETGSPESSPPQPNQSAEIRFAAFLSYLTSLYSDNEIDDWLGFLDDYVTYDREQTDFRHFLEFGESEPPSTRFAQLLFGGLKFTGDSYRFLATLNDGESGCYTFFLQYWLDRLLATGRYSSWSECLFRYCDRHFGGKNPLTDSGIGEQIDVLCRCAKGSSTLLDADSGDLLVEPVAAQLRPVTQGEWTRELWNSHNPDLWKKALDRYWTFVEPPNLALEREMDQLDAEAVRKMDPEAWYRFLLEKYFRWKYTAPNRYASTTKVLRTYAANNELSALHAIKERLFAANKDNVQQCLALATSVRGLGTAGASGLLAVLFPMQFGTVDQFALKALAMVPELPEQGLIATMNPESLSPHGGVVLIRIMRRKADELNRTLSTTEWTPRKVDMVLRTCGRR